MASLNGVYDENAELPGDFEVFDAGHYPVELTESDIVPTKNGEGKLFKYRAKITEGGLAERLVFGQMNMANKNPTAVKIGQQEFAALRLVTDTPNPEDTTDLHFKQFVAVIEVEAGKTVNGKEYGPRNVINWAKTAKLAQGEDVAAPVAANDNVKPETKAANDNVAAPAKAAPKAAAGGKGAWPKKK